MADETRQPERYSGISRRGFLKGVGTGAAATGLLTTIEPSTAEATRTKSHGPGAMKLSLKVNGQVHRTEAEPRQVLLDVLRQNLDITGPKPICERGACGGCTVLVDGEPVYSCMMLAIDAVRKEITTVEGLADGEKLDPVQEAFIEHDALMCGFCTPGFLMSVRALIDRNPNPSLDDVKEAVAGNTCRCGTYPRVFEAALKAAKITREEA
ncbi:TPA: oxidoreductase [Candidatus Latescibacteria bacterium]|nr:oxidoreductase [Candidatus Latescibacterota bacterium]